MKAKPLNYEIHEKREIQKSGASRNGLTAEDRRVQVKRRKTSVGAGGPPPVVAILLTRKPHGNKP